MKQIAHNRLWQVDELFQALRLQWLDEYILSQGLPHNPLLPPYPKSQEVLLQQAHWNSLHIDRSSWEHHDRFYVKWKDPSIGFGLFAHHQLAPETPVGLYLGHLRPINYRRDTLNPYCFSYPLRGHWHERILGSTWTINALWSGNHTRFINHSDTPNCRAQPLLQKGLLYILISTIDEINEGQELLYDYGTAYWQERTDKQAFE